MAWIDCLELYKDVMDHLNTSTNQTNPSHSPKWIITTVFNHQKCINSFKNLNLIVDLLVGNNSPASKLSTTSGRGLIQLAKGEATPQANMVVAQDGSGNFNTITEAIKASEKQRVGSHRFVIYVKAGIYEEKLVIKQSMTDLMLIGDGIDATIITSGKSSIEGLITFNTATVQVFGSGFVAVGITFENTAGPAKGQAVALLSASNLSAYYKCSFKGYQDTLCLFQNQQFYRECDIYGTVDFIFGDAAAVLQNCNIYIRTPLPGQENTITAQGRIDPASNTGFVIENSRVAPAPDTTLTAGSVMTFLGRPWRDYARVVYVKCFFDIMIDPAGWLPYKGNSAFEKVYYAEYMNYGKGAGTAGRVTWPGYHFLTTGEEVEKFSVSRFLFGESWIPQTGVPFNSGL
uniref:pectinesterase-like n=1 Tax=Erigeron canadensis TaxID=72917 RepID=UPI001CB8E81E|nr:pectinesterase-like [Erigeron canadensis]